MKLAQSLSPDNSEQVLFFHKCKDTDVIVYANSTTIWLTVNDVIQTAIERTAPYRPVLPHCFVMLLPLLHDRVPNTVLELGAGGAALQRYLRLSHPAIQMTSVENSAIILEAAKSAFPSYDTLNIVQQDAYAYVDAALSQNKSFDWLIVDLFYGADSPLLQHTNNFVKKLQKLVNHQGWLIINLLTKEQKILRRVTKTVAQFYGESIFLFAVPDMQNHILMAKQTQSMPFTFPAEIQQHNLINVLFER